ncbi:MAG: hypothetical protein K2H61_09240, partial [Muribaculaceae bacterium]|nr:hypothetical protein [Muribaculaceae bacterium]MDE7394475.1 hypothetical protein [Muribaculaceae bacterium]
CFAETGFATEDSLLPSGREYKQARREQSLRNDPRFNQIVELKRSGMSTRQISSQLGLSFSTLSTINKMIAADEAANVSRPDNER